MVLKIRELIDIICIGDKLLKKEFGIFCYLFLIVFFHSILYVTKKRERKEKISLKLI